MGAIHMILVAVLVTTAQGRWSWMCLTATTLLATNGTHLHLVGDKSLLCHAWIDFEVTGHVVRQPGPLKLQGQVDQIRVLKGRALRRWFDPVCMSNSTTLHTVALIQPSLRESWWCGPNAHQPCERFRLMGASLRVMGPWRTQHITCSPVSASQLPDANHASLSVDTVGSSVEFRYGGSYEMTSLTRLPDDITAELASFSSMAIVAF